jgi:hypothetical protein
VSIGVLAPVGGFAKSPVEVLGGMKRTKAAYEVFEYCSIKTYVCQKIVETASKQLRCIARRSQRAERFHA